MLLGLRVKLLHDTLTRFEFARKVFCNEVRDSNIIRISDVVLTASDPVRIILNRSDAKGRRPRKEIDTVDLKVFNAMRRRSESFTDLKIRVIGIREAQDTNVDHILLVRRVLEKERLEAFHRSTRLCDDVSQDLDVDV